MLSARVSSSSAWLRMVKSSWASAGQLVPFAQKRSGIVLQF